MFRWTALFLFVAITSTAVSPAVAQSTATTTGNYMIGGTMSWREGRFFFVPMESSPGLQ